MLSHDNGEASDASKHVNHHLAWSNVLSNSHSLMGQPGREIALFEVHLKDTAMLPMNSLGLSFTCDPFKIA